MNKDRRHFIKNAACLTAGLTLATLPGVAAEASLQDEQESGLYLIGRQKGYTPHIGTLLGTMTMMRTWIVRGVEELSVKELDFQIDDKSNSIGAMLWHLAATERYYQLNTFEGLEWGTWDDEIKEIWDLPMGLGEDGREKIKGNKIKFYLEKLESVRAETEKQFAERTDDWLWESENFFDNLPTNNYAKWFHVCEHESNHNGQIKFIKKRM